MKAKQLIDLLNGGRSNCEFKQSNKLNKDVYDSVCAFKS